MAQGKVANLEHYEEMISSAEAYKSPYEEWKESQGLPTIRGYWVEDVFQVELTPWEARGGSGVFVNLEGTGGFNDTYLYEMGPRESSVPVRHIYEETIYILKGQGATTIWNDEKKKQTFEWHERSYFAIPPNAWHQHHNLSGSKPARFIAMTAAPRVIDTFKDLDFVFNNPYLFKSRFDDEVGYFHESKRKGARGPWETNFVADVMGSGDIAEELGGREGRGAGSRGLAYAMVNSTVRSHSSSWPVGTYKKAHRHGPGIHVLILKGEGFTIMWQEGQPLIRIDWRPGSVLVPPEMWFHQHFNTGKEPTLFLAIGWGSDKPKAGGKQYVYKDVKEGGDQIEYEDENPAIHQAFEEAVGRSGAPCRMGKIHPLCTHR